MEPLEEILAHQPTQELIFQTGTGMSLTMPKETFGKAMKRSYENKQINVQINKQINIKPKVHSLISFFSSY